MTRRFSESQRVDLVVRAGGRCQLCGRPLAPGWHADHRMPYVHGGLTEISNGQALCPPCNLRKGSRNMELREWQRDALEAYFSWEGDDFLVEATPAAGKTTFALVVAQRLLQREAIGRIVIVVPTAHLKIQWAKAASRFGLHLDPNFENGNGVLATDYHGVIATYAQVASQPKLWEFLSAQQVSLVVLDEIHHASKDRSWGDGLRQAFADAPRRLSLSGTPFRTDGAPIPFVRYDSNGWAVASFTYGYKHALRDRDVVRAVEFIALDGAARWRQVQAITAVNLSAADDDQLARALASALDPSSDWIESVLRRADSHLQEMRLSTPDAGGLIIASDIPSARKIHVKLQQQTGERATLVVSDDPDASAKIEEYAQGKHRWIVAVQMVSEGVDIPRLAVCVWASRTRTEMFLRQVMGRIVRVRGVDDALIAAMFIPSIQPLLRFAGRIASEADAALAMREEQIRKQMSEPSRDTVEGDIVVSLPAGEAWHHSTIFAEETFTEPELERARQYREQVGMNAPDAQVARLLRLAGAGIVVGTATVPAPPEKTLAEQKSEMRRLVNFRARQIAHHGELDHIDVWVRLNSVDGGLKLSTATMEGLEARLDLAEKWLTELQ